MKKGRRKAAFFHPQVVPRAFSPNGKGTLDGSLGGLRKETGPWGSPRNVGYRFYGSFKGRPEGPPQ